MRKFVVGLLCGLFLSLSFNAYAAVESFIGKQVDNEYQVVLDGRTLDKKAIAVDGSSYAPVRVIAEQLGRDVEFKDDKVILSRKQSEAPIMVKIELINKRIDEKTQLIETYKKNIRGEEGNPKGVPAIAEVDQRYQNLIDALNTQIIELQQQKAELETTP